MPTIKYFRKPMEPDEPTSYRRNYIESMAIYPTVLTLELIESLTLDPRVIRACNTCGPTGKVMGAPCFICCGVSKHIAPYALRAAIFA